MLTKNWGLTVDGGHGTPLIWHTNTDPSWVMENKLCV